MKKIRFCPKLLTTLWEQINWVEYELKLKEYQKEIVSAVRKNNKYLIKQAQDKLVKSFEARALAVRHICSNKKASAGTDGVKWVTDEEKWNAAASLSPDGYKAKLMRLLKFTPEGDTKERHIHVSTFYDRAMQKLYAYALKPVAETTGDKKSFFSRDGRSMADAHAYIMKAFETARPPQYVIKTDVKSFYGTISHKWLLNNIPMDRNILTEFLKCGYVFLGEIFPSDDIGISLGSPLSSTLANMVLDGLQSYIYAGLNGPRNPLRTINYSNGNMIRFADDILITAASMKNAFDIFDIINKFIKVRGLTIQAAKTEFIKVREKGFVFLGHQYEYMKGTFHARPSDDAVAKFEESLKNFIMPYSGKQSDLIRELNKKLTGWANHHKYTDAGRAFHHVDCAVAAFLLDYCKIHHKRMTHKKIIDSFFFKMPDGGRVYMLEDRPTVRVIRLKDIPLAVHNPIAVRKNPFTDEDYFERLTHEREITMASGDYKGIWKRQAGKCFYCGKKILADERKSIVPVDPALPPGIKNRAYVHTFCKDCQLEIYEVDEPITTYFDLYNYLEKLDKREPLEAKKNKFRLLKEHFKRRTEAAFSLQFYQIEHILQHELCKTARTQVNYWNGVSLSKCWKSNGYEIRNVNLKKGFITFQKCENLGVMLKIPPEFLEKMPVEMNDEMMMIFDFVLKRWGMR